MNSTTKKHHHLHTNSKISDFSFRLDLAIGPPKNDISNIDANFTLISSHEINTKKTSKIPYFGISFKNQTFFILVGTLSKDDEIDYEWARSFFRNCTISYSNGKVNFYFNHKKHISKFISEYPNKHITFRIVTISFLVSKSQIIVNPNSRFSLPIVAKGTLYTGNEIKKFVNGYEYDSTHFSIEIRLFLVMIGFSMCLSFFGWRSLSSFAVTQAHISSISFLTLLMIFSLDIAVCLDLNRSNDCYSPPTLLSIFLFFVQLIIYLTMQFPVIYIVFKQQNIMNLPIPQIFIQIFTFSIVLLAAHSFHNHKILSIIVAFMQFTPQIIKNLNLSQKRGICFSFVFMVSLNRIIVFLYSDCYKYNIYETNYIQKFSISSLLIVLQCFTLFLQEKFGPYFFIPRLFKPKPFNYRAISPEPGTECLICRDIIIPVDDSAVTPCHHAFHMECLSRWMEEKQQCPLCRAQIPPIINVFD